MRSPVDDGYTETAKSLFELVQSQPGFLAADSARGPDGLGITVAYFTDEPSITTWKSHPIHAEAQPKGRAKWYDSYALHIAKVERAYRFDR